MGKGLQDTKLQITSDGHYKGCSAYNKSVCIITDDYCNGCSTVDIIDLDGEE